MNLMKIFGCDSEEDDYDENEDYQTEERERRKPSRQRREGSSRSGSSSGASAGNGKLILFNGIASDSDKIKLREAFNNGAMILIDLHELTQIEFEQAGGKDFITFMGRVAFARNGVLIPIEPSQYLVAPRSEMFEVWPIEGNDE